MSKKKSRGLVPELRFPEFRDAGEWDNKEFKRICEINPSVGSLPEVFVYIDLESVEDGRLLRKKKISREEAPSRAQRLLKDGDIIFQMVRPYQKNNFLFQLNDNLEYVASTGYAQLRAYESNTFLFQYLHNDRFVERVLAKCTGSNYPAINSGDLSELLVEIPPAIKEQQRIADFLSSIDKLITAESLQLENLRAHKKGLMQQLFPAEGECVPALRFPEFRDKGEWVENRLENIVSKSISYGIVQAGEHVENGMPYITSTDLNTSLEEVEFRRTSNEIALKYRRSEVTPGDIVFSLRGNIGVCQILPSNIAVANLTQGTARISVSNSEYNLFILYVLRSPVTKSRIMAVIKGSTFQEISLSDLRLIELKLPSFPEQQKIADCLKSIDELITAQTKKIDALKLHKKGLMQKLFPVEEAE